MLNFISRNGEPDYYWLNTSANELIEVSLRTHGPRLQPMFETLLTGGALELELEFQLGALLLNVLSYHDFGPAELPERFYQAFLLGLLCVLEPDYRVRSNRESGKRQPDVQIFPNQPGRPGVLLELKVARGKKTLDSALAEGVAQAHEQGYAAELTARGADPIHAFALAFDGKELRVAAIEL